MVLSFLGASGDESEPLVLVEINISATIKIRVFRIFFLMFDEWVLHCLLSFSFTRFGPTKRSEGVEG